MGKISLDYFPNIPDILISMERKTDSKFLHSSLRDKLEDFDVYVEGSATQFNEQYTRVLK